MGLARARGLYLSALKISLKGKNQKKNSPKQDEWRPFLKKKCNVTRRKTELNTGWS